MSEKKNPLDGLKVIEPGQGEDAQESVFVGEQEVAGPGQKFANENGAPEQVGSGEPPNNPNMISPEQFYQSVKMAFAAPQMVSPAFEPIAIQPNEVEMARQATDSAHALLLMWYPQALRPGNETLGHVLMMTPFLASKVMIIYGIIKQARTPPQHDTNGADNAEDKK